MSDLREKLAEFCHKIGNDNIKIAADDLITIADNDYSNIYDYLRFKDYVKLREEEKEHHRKEADKILDIMADFKKRTNYACAKRMSKKKNVKRGGDE